MFVSQVIFESELGNEEKLKAIMEKKLEGAKAAPGVIQAECWKLHKASAAGYALVTRWESQEQFRSWLVASHKGVTHGTQHKDGEKAAITKMAYQFEVIDQE
ncbi:MAG: hypothetical protein GX096_10110 [Clostridiales bacterium]|nr:hypothetical protein [Clostridiales bacterium]